MGRLRSFRAFLQFLLFLGSALEYVQPQLLRADNRVSATDHPGACFQRNPYGSLQENGSDRYVCASFYIRCGHGGYDYYLLITVHRHTGPIHQMDGFRRAELSVGSGLVQDRIRSVRGLAKHRMGTIIYLVALSGVDPQRHEAAIVDGASRFKRLLHINLPAILPTITILLILNIGNILTIGFEKYCCRRTP